MNTIVVKKVNEIERFRENPFCKNLSIKTKNKQVRISKVEKKKDENILIDVDTGEVAYTHMVTYKEVDNAEFVKIFSENISLTFNLSSSGLKALNVVIYEVQRNALGKDIIYLGKITLEDFIKKTKLKLGMSTFRRGISELIHNKIIARSLSKGGYFINPNFIFNGDRFAFTTAIKKKKQL